MDIHGIDVQPGTRLEVEFIYDFDDPRYGMIVNTAVFDGRAWIAIASDNDEWLEVVRNEETWALVGLDDPEYGYWHVRESSRGSLVRSHLVSPTGEPIEMGAWYPTGS